MAQIYRIYINDAVVTITDFSPPDVENYKLLNSDKFNFQNQYRKIKDGSAGSRFLVLVKDPKSFFKSLKQSVTIVKAAGGVVRNEENKVLFIFRKGTWDLPKGKLDEKEKTRKAAVREVEEECGIEVTRCGKKLCKTWHAYESNGEIVLKPTSWYKMHAYHQPDLVPQLEEDITDAKWVAHADFGKIRKNTYPLILDIMNLLEEDGL